MTKKEDKFKGNKKIQLEKARARGEVTAEEYEEQKAKLDKKEDTKESKEK